MIETPPIGHSAPGEHLREAAAAVLARYPSAPATETEAAIAMLALWAIDAVEGAQISASEADSLFTLLDIAIDETDAGPELSDSVTQLMLEGLTLHDQGTPFGADLARMRSLALGILRADRSDD